MEWFNDKDENGNLGEPHTFKIYLLFGGNDTEVTDEIYRAINLAKPARSHYVIIAVEEVKSGIISSGAMTAISHARAVANVNL